MLSTVVENPLLSLNRPSTVVETPFHSLNSLSTAVETCFHSLNRLSTAVESHFHPLNALSTVVEGFLQRACPFQPWLKHFFASQTGFQPWLNACCTFRFRGYANSSLRRSVHRCRVHNGFLHIVEVDAFEVVLKELVAGAEHHQAPFFHDSHAVGNGFGAENIVRTHQD